MLTGGALVCGKGVSAYANHDDDGNENVTKTKGLKSKTVAVHVRYKSLYISLPSSAKH